jgi:hypothetical protein
MYEEKYFTQGKFLLQICRSECASVFLHTLPLLRKEIISLVRGPIDIVPFSVCTEYEVQGSLITFKV